MNYNIEKIRKQILIFSILGYIVLITFAIGGLYKIQLNNINEEIEKKFISTKYLFDKEIKDEAVLLDDLIYVIMQNQSIMDAFLKKDKDLLYARTKDIYASLKQNSEITHFYAIDKDKRCILRVHNPKRVGDVIKRYSLDKAVSEGKNSYGLELGVAGTLTLRDVHPYFVNGKIKGYIELGKEIEAIVREIKDVDTDIIVCLRKNLLKKKEWEEGLKTFNKMGDWDEFSDFLITAKTNKDIPKELESLLRENFKNLKNKAYDLSVDKESFKVRFSPLIDIKGEDVGSIILLNNITSKKNSLNKMLFLIIVMVIILTFLFTLFIGILKKGFDQYNEALLFEISQRKQTQIILNENAEKYKALMDAIPLGIFKVTPAPKSHFIMANVYTAKMFGYEGLEDLYKADGFSFYKNPLDEENMSKKIIEHGAITNEEAFLKRLDGTIFWGEISAKATKDSDGKTLYLDGVVKDITELKSAQNQLKDQNTVLTKTLEDLKKEKLQEEQLVSAIPSFFICLDKENIITHWNQAASVLFNIPSSEAIGKSFEELDINFDKNLLIEKIEYCRVTYNLKRIDEFSLFDNQGHKKILGIILNPIKINNYYPGSVIIMGSDITERKNLESQLSQAQKLESIGQLAAGIAHEINTPTQFVGDNTSFLKDSFNDLKDLIDSFKDLFNEVKTDEKFGQKVSAIDDKITKIDLEYLEEEIPTAINQSLDGVKRISSIVRAMKEFSHPNTSEMKPTDINHSIESTTTISRNEWKYTSELVLNLDLEIPLVPCLPGEFNQVILNLIINASHAIISAKEKDPNRKGIITISTSPKNGFVVIKISDTGTGIPEDIRDKVFDPFFTTKEIGKGTGQGLAIAYSVIVDKHKGKIYFESEIGVGTTFIIELPV